MDKPIKTTEHAIERYSERVRELPHKQAKQELLRLIEMGTLCDPPDWLPEYYQREGQVFCEFAPGIVAAMMPDTNALVVTTVLVRGSRSDTERRNRKRKQKEAKAKRRAHEQYLRASGHRNKAAVKRRAEERNKPNEY